MDNGFVLQGHHHQWQVDEVARVQEDLKEHCAEEVDHIAEEKVLAVKQLVNNNNRNPHQKVQG